MVPRHLNASAQRPLAARRLTFMPVFALFVAATALFYPAPVWAAPAATAQPDCGAPATPDVVADAWLEQNAPSANYGSDELLHVKTHGSIKLRTLVRFGSPSVPTGCVVESAILRLYAKTWSEGRHLSAVSLARDWSENTVTWGNQPATTAGYTATVSSGNVVAWDVTHQVQAMLDVGANYGFQIRDVLEGNGGDPRPGSGQQFFSRERGENMPELVISWMPAPDTTAPETTLESGPAATTTGTDATFTFSANEPGSSFACSLDGAAFAPCTSSAVYTGVPVGQHSFAVRATDPAGNVDETPATHTWTVEADTDGDGLGDNVDADGDNDGQSDGDEATCGSDPLNAASTSPDFDDDGSPDCIDADDDNDGVGDGEDAFPLDAGETTDTDGDGTGNHADTDDDNDGTDDGQDAFPLDPGETSGGQKPGSTSGGQEPGETPDAGQTPGGTSGGQQPGDTSGGQQPGEIPSAGQEPPRSLFLPAVNR